MRRYFNILIFGLHFNDKQTQFVFAEWINCDFLQGFWETALCALIFIAE